VIADTLGAILKYQDDIQKLQGSEAGRLLDEVRANWSRMTLHVWLKYPRGSGGVKPPGLTPWPTRMDLPPLDMPDDGKLAHNITHFARALRKAGLPIGPGRTLDATRAVARRRASPARGFLPHAAGLFSSSAAPKSARSSPRCSACSGATRAILIT
jgi:hypothetical protein